MSTTYSCCQRAKVHKWVTQPGQLQNVNVAVYFSKALLLYFVQSALYFFSDTCVIFLRLCFITLYHSSFIFFHSAFIIYHSTFIFFHSAFIILKMFQMLVLIMYKTSRFWLIVLPDDDDANTIKVLYSHTSITHITGVGVYRVIEGCSALSALCLLDRSKSETQGQLSRCGGVIRPRLCLLHLDSRDSYNRGSCAVRI